MRYEVSVTGMGSSRHCVEVAFGPAGRDGDAGSGGGAGATDLAYSANATAGVVSSNTGDDATILAATASIAGLMVPAQFSKLAGIETGATAYTDEMARDAIGTALVAGSNVTITVDDTANTITLASTGGTTAINYTQATAPSGASAGEFWLRDTDGVVFVYYDSTWVQIGGSSYVAAAPAAHKTTHQTGGADAIKLDDLAAPDDNTDLNATTSAHGLLPKLGGGTTNFLRADGTWSAPSGGGSGVAAAAGSIWRLDGLATGTALHFPIGTTLVARAATAGDEWWIPIELVRGFDASGLAINVTTLAASSIARLGLYADSSGLPGSLIEDAGTVATDTTGAKTASFATTRTLAAGYYWGYVKVTGGAPTTLVANWSGGPLWAPQSSAFAGGTTIIPSGLLRSGQAAGAAPSPAPALGSSNLARFTHIIALIAA